jgi:uncharacterized membrane protein YphA (DoxX/SURF4 family)
MPISRRIARPLLASMFVVGGLDAVRNPGGKVKAAEAVTGPLSEHVAIVPNDPELLVRINGAVQVGAGVLLATGRLRRLASVALIASIIPTTYAGHRFWEETDEAERAQQRVHFFKNLGLLGGLLLAATDTEGEPSLSWRAKRRARKVGTAVALGRSLTAAKAHGAATDVTGASSRTARRARRAAGLQARRQVGAVRNVALPKGLDVARHAGDGAASVTRRAGLVAARAAHEAAPIVLSAARAAHEAAPIVLSAARAGGELASPYVASGVERTTELLNKAVDHLPVS